jgi:hypothetical protein
MKLFVSYRRSDTAHFAARMAERLAKVRGITTVFVDVTSIGAGEQFARRIHDEIAQCAVALVVIGPGWLAPRLFEDADYVRLEVREALALSRVLPVLADGAVMPAPEALPPDVRPLAALNAHSVRHDAFDRDMASLIDAVLERRSPGQLRQFLQVHPVVAAVVDAVGGIVAAFLLLVLALAVLNALTGRALDETVGGAGMAMIVTAIVLAAGAAAPWYLRRRGILH